MSKALKDVCNAKVFESIFNTYAKDLKRFIVFKIKDIDAAEDIVQDAFVKLWDNCKNVNYSTVKNFLFTIANNIFLNKVKHNKVIHNYQQGNKKESTNESPEFLFLEEEFYNKLTKAIDELPEKQREVFIMSRIEKLKYKAIAEQLGVTTKAIEKRMQNALENLRNTLGDIL